MKFPLLVLLLSNITLSKSEEIICHEILSSPQSICGVEIEELNQVNQICTNENEVSDEEMYDIMFNLKKYHPDLTWYYYNRFVYELQIKDEFNTKVLGSLLGSFDEILDGGSEFSERTHVIKGSRTTQYSSMTTGLDCEVYLNLNDRNNYIFKSKKKFHICEGNISNRKYHPEERCR